MDGEWVGEHVTKNIYIETDGRHAFYAGGQTYAGVDGETILEMVTSWTHPYTCRRLDIL